MRANGTHITGLFTSYVRAQPTLGYLSRFVHPPSTETDTFNCKQELTIPDCLLPPQPERILHKNYRLSEDYIVFVAVY